MFRKKHLRVVLIISFISALIPYSSIYPADSTKRILVLFPFQSNIPQTKISEKVINEETSGIKSLSVEVYYEYMDTNRFPGKSYQQQLLNSFESKYRGRNIDIVMLVSDPVIDLWLTNPPDALRNIPVVFFDVTPKYLTKHQIPEYFTGITPTVNHSESISWILKIRPNIDEVIIINGKGKADTVYLEPLFILKNTFKDRVRLTDWSDLPFSEMKYRAALLPESSVILYHLLFEDSSGAKFRPIDALKELSEVSSVPVISGYDQFIGTGTIGGYMYSIEEQAREAVTSALNIISNKPIKVKKISTDTGTRFIFDHAALKKYGISLSELPRDSIVKNRQYSIWDLYTAELVAIIVSFVVLIIFIVFLIFLAKQLSNARRELKGINTDLEIKVKERTSDLTRTNRNLNDEIAERRKVESRQARLISEFQNAQNQIKNLRGMLPICSSCKKIRDDDGYWQDVAIYIRDHSDADLSHGLCPDCAKKLYPEYFSEMFKKKV